MLALLPAGPAASMPPAGCMPPLFKLTAAAMLRSKAALQPSASQVGASGCRSSTCSQLCISMAVLSIQEWSAQHAEELLASVDHNTPS